MGDRPVALALFLSIAKAEPYSDNQASPTEPLASEQKRLNALVQLPSSLNSEVRLA